MRASIVVSAALQASCRPLPGVAALAATTIARLHDNPARRTLPGHAWPAFSYVPRTFLIIFLRRGLRDHPSPSTPWTAVRLPAVRAMRAEPRPAQTGEITRRRWGVRTQRLATARRDTALHRPGPDRRPPASSRQRRYLRRHRSGEQSPAGAGRGLRCGRRRRGSGRRPPRLRRRPLGASRPGRAQARAAAPGRADAGPSRRAGAARLAEHGQAGDGRLEHRCTRRRPRLRLVCGKPRQALRPGRADRPADPGHHYPRAAGGDRRGGAVELPARHGRLEARPGPGRRQLGGAQAGRAVAVLRPAPGRAWPWRRGCRKAC